MNPHRQIVLDTETTGLDPAEGHRIIEIGCVELMNRRLTGNNFHQYINPERNIDEGAIAVHGLTNAMLSDKPTFWDIANAFCEYIQGAELIIHNAPFDVGFLDYELGRLQRPPIKELCSILDTLELARKLHPGQRNSLDALCKRYDINNSHRQLHGALLDAEILSDVYLTMTGGQVSLALEVHIPVNPQHATGPQRLSIDRTPLKVIRATDAELAAHRARLEVIEQASGGMCVWKALEPDS